MQVFTVLLVWAGALVLSLEASDQEELYCRCGVGNDTDVVQGSECWVWRPPCSTSLVTWLVVVAVPGLLLPLHTLLAATSTQGQVRAVAGVTLVSGDTCLRVYAARVRWCW